MSEERRAKQIAALRELHVTMTKAHRQLVPDPKPYGPEGIPLETAIGVRIGVLEGIRLCAHLLFGPLGERAVLEGGPEV